MNKQEARNWNRARRNTERNFLINFCLPLKASVIRLDLDDQFSLNIFNLCLPLLRPSHTPTIGPSIWKNRRRTNGGIGFDMSRFIDTRLKRTASEIMAMHMSRNFVINGVTSELMGMLPATIRHKNERDRKDSMARPTLSPVTCGEENVRMAKHVITNEGMMTLNKKNPGCLSM